MAHPPQFPDSKRVSGTGALSNSRCRGRGRQSGQLRKRPDRRFAPTFGFSRRGSSMCHEGTHRLLRRRFGCRPADTPRPISSCLSRVVRPSTDGFFRRGSFLLPSLGPIERPVARNALIQRGSRRDDQGLSKGPASAERVDYPGKGCFQNLGVTPGLEARASLLSDAGISGFYDNGSSFGGQGADSFGRYAHHAPHGNRRGSLGPR